MSMPGQPKGHLWLVFTMLFVTFAIHGEGASSFAPPSPVIKVIGKVYCYRCFNEAHPEESHGKKHLEGEILSPPLLLIIVSLEIYHCSLLLIIILLKYQLLNFSTYPKCPPEFHTYFLIIWVQEPWSRSLVRQMTRHLWHLVTPETMANTV